MGFVGFGGVRNVKFILYGTNKIYRIGFCILVRKPFRMRLSLLVIYVSLSFHGAELKNHQGHGQDKRDTIDSEAEKSKCAESLPAYHRNTGAAKTDNIGRN